MLFSFKVVEFIFVSPEKKERPQDFLRRVLKEDPNNFYNLENLYSENFETYPHLKAISRARRKWLEQQRSFIDPLELKFGRRLTLVLYEPLEHLN